MGNNFCRKLGRFTFTGYGYIYFFLPPLIPQPYSKRVSVFHVRSSPLLPFSTNNRQILPKLLLSQNRSSSTLSVTCFYFFLMNFSFTTPTQSSFDGDYPSCTIYANRIAWNVIKKSGGNFSSSWTCFSFSNDIRDSF